MTFSQAAPPVRPAGAPFSPAAPPPGSSGTVLAEFRIVPVGGEAHLSEELAEVLQEVARCGLPYELTPSGTCLEGPWEAVLGCIQRCHARVRRHRSHVMTTIHIEDDAGATHKLVDNVASVAAKAGVPNRRLTV